MLTVNLLKYIKCVNNGIRINFIKILGYCILYEMRGVKSNNKNKQCIC